jgi:ABC-type multidrug transport system fused ATPase/permease subunit
LVGIVGDCGLLIMIFVALMIVDFEIAILTLFGVFLVAIILNRSMHRKAEILGKQSSHLYVTSALKFEEFANNYREITIRNRRHHFINSLVSLRAESSAVNAKLMMMPNISKYIVETVIVVGSLLIAGIQFARTDAIHAIATLSLFLASGARIAPALLRIQQSVLQIHTNLASATETIEILQSITVLPESIEQNYKSDFTQIHKGFIPCISFENISFKHAPEDGFEIKNISFNVQEGEMIAIVGRSGSGKSTIIDLLLGTLSPNSGEINISNMSPTQAFETWPGAVAYVPQQVYLSSGSIYENVIFGYEDQKIDSSVVLESIRSCDLETFYLQSMDPKAQEMTNLSGGQLQRIGIARALLTKPRLLVLDEATSSLDAMTENSINLVLQELRGANTLVVVAHRLSTIRNADRVIYVDNGRIMASGTFEEVRSQIEDFDTQAKLLGIE